MVPNCKVAFKKNRKYFRGKLVDEKIIGPKQYMHLSDIPKFDKYITIKFYIRKSKADINLKSLLKKLEIDNLYLLLDEISVSSKKKTKVYKVTKEKVDKSTLSVPLSADLTLRGWEKAWFKIKNKLCVDCTKKCKQSARVTIINCPFYKSKNNG
ncbi:MAG: hypothetical protein WC346_11975 [Methanogenium sp.]|jgi:hypothetical protein